MREPNFVKPTLGCVVLYTLTEQDVHAIETNRSNGLGRGNSQRQGDQVAATVVRVWNANVVNLQLHLDGTDTLWKTSVSHETEAVAVARPGLWVGAAPEHVDVG